MPVQWSLDLYMISDSGRASACTNFGIFFRFSRFSPFAEEGFTCLDHSAMSKKKKLPPPRPQSKLFGYWRRHKWIGHSGTATAKQKGWYAIYPRSRQCIAHRWLLLHETTGWVKRSSVHWDGVLFAMFCKRSAGVSTQKGAFQGVKNGVQPEGWNASDYRKV